MTRSETGEESPERETDPALPTPASEESGDQITKIIGNVGRWQLEKILLVFLASAPGKHMLRASMIIKQNINIKSMILY